MEKSKETWLRSFCCSLCPGSLTELSPAGEQPHVAGVGSQHCHPWGSWSKSQPLSVPVSSHSAMHLPLPRAKASSQELIGLCPFLPLVALWSDWDLGSLGTGSVRFPFSRDRCWRVE